MVEATSTSVDDSEYRVPFRFTGKINHARMSGEVASRKARMSTAVVNEELLKERSSKTAAA